MNFVLKNNEKIKNFDIYLKEGKELSEHELSVLEVIDLRFNSSLALFKFGESSFVIRPMGEIDNIEEYINRVERIVKDLPEEVNHFDVMGKKDEGGFICAKNKFFNIVTPDEYVAKSEEDESLNFDVTVRHRTMLIEDGIKGVVDAYLVPKK